MFKPTIIGLLIVLVLIIVYQFYKINEGFAIGDPRIVTGIQLNDPFIDIIAKTTDGSTIRGVKILYSSTTPVLAKGQSTDSSLALNLAVSPTLFPVTNKPLTSMKEGYKYYFVTSDVVKYIEGETPLLGSFVYTRIVATTQLNDQFIDIIAKTTDGSTIQGVKILYNSGTPILPVGESTDSSLALNLAVSPTLFPVTNKPLTSMQEGYKYYFVTSDVVKYTEGVTPLLGSFIYIKPVGAKSTPQTQPVPAIPALPAVPAEPAPSTSSIPSAPEAPVPPTAPPAIPATSTEAAIAKEKQDRANLLRDIQQVVKNELLEQQKLTTASSQAVLNGGSSNQAAVSPAMAQGQELSTKREKSCPKDMSEYIRKDSIPCWNCTLDY